MTAKFTLLDIMKDYDGEYHFLAVRQCANHKEAANMAWDIHKKFMETEDGAGFKRRDALNSDEGDFRTDIDAFDEVVTMSEDGKYMIVYRIIPIYLNIDVGVEYTKTKQGDRTMTAKFTLLDILKDYDGEYDSPAVRQCANHEEAANMAWDMHKKFMGTEDGAGFKRRGALNSDEGDFRTDIDAFDVVVTMSEDGKYRIVYRIISVDLNIDVSVE